MKEILEKFEKVRLDPYESLSEWKKQNNKRIFGCFPMYFPEEMVHAAGMLPVVIWESNQPITLGHAHVKPYNCGLVRSFIDDAVIGRLSFMDGMVFYDTCLQARSLPYVIGKNAPPAYLEPVYLTPMMTSPAAKPHLMENLNKFRKSLEEFSGQKITDEALRESFLVYNKNRALLRRLYDLRRRKPGLLKARDVMTIVRSSMLMPKEEHSQLLEKLLSELESKQTAPDGRIKVVIAGHLCQAPTVEIFDLIEEGAAVVDDDMFTGYKYFANDIDINQDPIGALADRFMQRFPPCPTKVDWETHWGDYITEMVNKSGAQGVVSLMVKYCPPHYCYYPDFKNKLAEANIPEALIETEHEVVSLEQVKTRIQAFIEAIGGV